MTLVEVRVGEITLMRNIILFLYSPYSTVEVASLFNTTWLTRMEFASIIFSEHICEQVI